MFEMNLADTHVVHTVLCSSNLESNNGKYYSFVKQPNILILSVYFMCN